MSKMAGSASDESRVIITSPEAVDMKQAVNDHFQKSIENAMANLASSGGQPLTRPWPGRNLPEAFFSKPAASTKSKTSSNTPLSHSRDGSTDSSGRYTLSPPNTASSCLSPIVQHSRTHSSPAIISNVQQQNNYSSSSSSNSQQTNLPSFGHHQKHRSFDNTLDVDNSLQATGGGWHQQMQQQHQQPLYGEKTSKSLGDLVTPNAGMDSGLSSMGGQGQGQMDVGYGEQARKNSCSDASMTWNDFPAGQNVQKPQSHFMRQQRYQQSSSVPSGGVRSQIMKRQQQQQQHQQQCQHQPPPSNAGSNFVNPVVQELNQERQRMYERNLQLRQQGLLDPLPSAHSLSPGNHYHPDTLSDLTSFQYPTSSNNAPRTLQNPHYQQQHPSMFHMRQGSSDSGLEMQLSGGGGGYSYPYARNPQELVDLNFGNINLDPSTLMDVDPSTIPAGTLDIAPDDLDQYLNH